MSLDVPLALPRWRSRFTTTAWWVPALTIAVASRILSVALLLTGTGVTSVVKLHDEGLTMYDGQWYLGIAASGYHVAGIPGPNGDYHDYAFFPLWPSIIGALSRVLPIAPGFLAVALANILFCVAAVVMWRCVAPRFGPSAATTGVLLLSFSPAAYVFSMAYSEALFLLLAAVALATPIASGRRAMLAAVSQATRLPGFAISASALTSLRAFPRNSLIVLGAAPAVFGAWWLFIAHLTGDPLGYLRGTPTWWTIAGAPAGPLSWRPVLDDAFLNHELHRFAAPAVVLCLMTPLIVATLALLWDARRRDLGWYSAAAILPTVLLASWEQWPRHSLLAFPAFAWLGALLGSRLRWVVVATFIGAQVGFVTLVTHNRMTP